MNINYQASVAIQSAEFFNFLSPGGGAKETPIHAAPWINVWEAWKIINFNDPSSTANVKFGDIVSFENNNFSSRFLSGFPGYVQVTTMDAMQDFERWKLVDPTNPSSTADITTANLFVLQLVNGGGSHHAQVTGENIQQSVPLGSLGSEFRLIQLSVS
ncbi:MAG: hypothetical protein F9K23_14140 [Bacteroidetes bacterium]|nr:MAG: hypothetical protein F9K23_14140 [Bacteroidota bacterium]